MLEFPLDLQERIRNRINETKGGAPDSLSDDLPPLAVDGGVGYACFLSPSGDAFIENYEFDLVARCDRLAECDRSRRAEIQTLVLGSRHDPELARLLPTRTKNAYTCETCQGWGFVGLVPGKLPFLCQSCCGLGWKSPGLME